MREKSDNLQKNNDKTLTNETTSDQTSTNETVEENKNYKEKLYDKLPITVKMLDGIILIFLGGFALFLIYILFFA